MSPIQPSRLAFVGECMVELKEVAAGTVRQTFAGDTLNSAVYARRILPMDLVEVSYVTGLGSDDFSHRMLEMWRSEGIKTDALQVLENKQPGLYYIHVDAMGERSFSYWRSDSAARYMFSGLPGCELLEKLMKFDWIYLSGISLAILPEDDVQKVLDALETFSGKLIFDNNFRPTLWPDKNKAQNIYKRVLACTDIALLTWDDERALFDFEQPEQSKRQCEALGINEIVIKRGSDACLIYFGAEQFSIPAQKVAHVVDTTAAGDSFSAAYLSARLTGEAPATAAAWGHCLAASVIQHQGGIIGREFMPSMQLDKSKNRQEH